jgi:hypothetical protein
MSWRKADGPDVGRSTLDTVAKRHRTSIVRATMAYLARFYRDEFEKAGIDFALTKPPTLHPRIAVIGALPVVDDLRLRIR